MRRKKKDTIYMLLIMILGLTLGFALLSTTLKINGTAGIKSNSWNVYWDSASISVNDKSVSTEKPTVGGTNNDTVSYTVELELPGDFYEFTIDAVNAGTVDAMISDNVKITYKDGDTVIDNLPSYLISTITYGDGEAIGKGHLLAKATDVDHPTRENYKIRIEYDSKATTLPPADKLYTINIEIPYTQADKTAVPVRVDFEESSWDDIISAYKAGNTDQLEEAMKTGTTREVEMDLDNDGTKETYHLRIANLSSPSECSTEGFSQTACGLVIEFADIISQHRMNPYTDGSTDGNGNNGGWEYSDMRAYLNSTTYEAGSINYSTSGILNALPSDLKNKIIDTTVVSGHGSNDTANFTTTDKLYLLSLREIWDYMMSVDTAQGVTRQLDYYAQKEVTNDSYEAVIKKYNGVASMWWVRTSYSGTNRYFSNAHDSGKIYSDSSDTLYGVSPAFRLAK